MKRFVTVVLFLGCLRCSAAPEENASLLVDQLTEKVFSGRDLLDISKLDADVKQEMRHAIRSKMQEQRVLPNYSLVALINLGDTNAMQQAMTLRNTPELELFGVRVLGSTLRRNCNQPRFLPFLANDLMIDELPYRRRVGDVAFSARSVDAARIMQAILVRSDEFPPEVRTWAGQLDVRNRTRIRSKMRKWWKENAEPVPKGQYSKTKALVTE